MPAARELRDRAGRCGVGFALTDVIADDQSATRPQHARRFGKELLGRRTVDERFDRVREVGRAHVGWQRAVITFTHANAMTQSEGSDTRLALLCLNRTQRHPDARELAPLGQVQQAGADATAKINDMRRAIEGQRIDLAGNQILDVPEGPLARDGARTPDGAMDRAKGAALAVPDEGVGVGVVVAANVSRRETGFGQRVKVQ